MLSRNRRSLWLAIIVLVPILVIWGYLGSPVPVKKPAQVVNRNAYDFFIEHATIHRWNAQGVMQGQWQAARMDHVPDTNSNNMIQPSGIILNDAGKTYKIHAKTGTWTDSQSQIVLAGDVEVNHNPPSGPLQRLKTQTLTYYPDRRFAETDQKVLYTQGSLTQTSANGADVYLDKRLIDLLSDVRGTYNAKSR